MTTRSTRRLPALLVGCAAALVAFVPSGCSNGSSNHQPVATRLAKAKASFDRARFIGFTLTSQHLPSGVDALQGATGTGTHAPAFTGSVQVVKGLSFTAKLVAVNGKVYADLPFVSWSTINPADYGAPNPARLMDRAHGLSALLTATRGAANDGTERSGSTVLTKITGTLPGTAVKGLFPSSATTPFQVTYDLTDADALERVTMTGQFYAGHGSTTYIIDLNLSASPVTITPPG